MIENQNNTKINFAIENEVSANGPMMLLYHFPYHFAITWAYFWYNSAAFSIPRYNHKAINCVEWRGKTEKFSSRWKKFHLKPAKRSVKTGWHELCYIRRALGGQHGGRYDLKVAGNGATHLFNQQKT